MAEITLLRAGPGVTVQDKGRSGFLAQGLSRGGAADRLALVEGSALLGQASEFAALEVAGSFLSLTASAPVRIALTGAPMRALCEGVPLVWNASHAVPAGALLEISGSRGGYSYVHFGGGVAPARTLGACSAHLGAGIGRMLAEGDRLPLGAETRSGTGRVITPQDRFSGGVLRMVETPQTLLFPQEMRESFTNTKFRKDARGNRMGQRLVSEASSFNLPSGLSILSEAIVPGDIQITGDGAPFVLLAECQTTGGYPRIGTVLPCDLPKMVQAPANADLQFQFVTLEQATSLERAEAIRRADLRKTVRPLIRNPHDIADLLAYQLVSGVTCGDDLERAEPC